MSDKDRRGRPGALLSVGLVLAVVMTAGCELEVNINAGFGEEVTQPAPATVEMPPPAPPAAPQPGSTSSLPAIDPSLGRGSYRDISAEPVFTPFTLAPRILNIPEVQRTMVLQYPTRLRDAGIGGTVRVYFFIDESGQVQDKRIDRSSGHPALDEAALAVADVYRFSPALNRDDPVPVWVSFPITFQVR